MLEQDSRFSNIPIKLTNEKIDDQLKTCKLIINTADSETKDIRINSKVLFAYEKALLDEIDHRHVYETLSKYVNLKNEDKKIKFDNKFDQKLEFKTCVLTADSSVTESSKNICYICLLEFACNESFEEHLELHISTSNFDWIEKTIGSSVARFRIIYQISDSNKDSQFLKFTLYAKCSDISLNAVFTVRSKDILLLVNHMEKDVLLDADGTYEFLIDKHIFSGSFEQPIYVIYHIVNVEKNQRERFVELHLIRPYFLLPKRNTQGNAVKKSELKKKKGTLPQHFPRNSLKDLYNSIENFTEIDLFNIDRNFRKFCEVDEKKLSPLNISNVFTFLLEMEQVEIQRLYSAFSQVQKTIKYSKKTFGNAEYFVKLDNISDDLIFQTTITCGDTMILNCNDNSVVNCIDSSLVENKTNFVGNRHRERNSTKFFCIISNICGPIIYFEHQNKRTINNNKKYDIIFRPNERNFNYQYRALNAIDEYSLLSIFLFPENKPFELPASLDLNIFDNNVKNNPEQKEAVVNVVDGIKDFCPYIIVGPPGTGKTTTIVECILQLQINKPEARILVTAGSNAACDVIAKKLIKIINSDFQHIKMLRLYSKSAEKYYDHIEDELVRASNLMYGDHYYPSMETINEYNILICTTSLIGRLKTAGLKPSFFTYCFIDECAALTEPETLVVIEAVFHSNINIIITGDPKQLGPITQSDRAAEYGLKHSLLERLSNRECYKVNSNGNYNRRIQTRLIRNFRTHQDILTISNKLFYSNDLLACASINLTHWATGWCNLPQKNIPLIFHCVKGYTKKDKYSTSLFNHKEVNCVMDYIKKLMYFELNNRKIEEKDIGIISPYNKQNLIIREELNKRNWYKIATGSVENFQGQEKPIIIISTVRSVLSDRCGVGFLTNEKRLNVMLTRAQALLIIIGNTECLSSVSDWKESIEYCKEKNVIIKTENDLDLIQKEDMKSVDVNSFKKLVLNS